jgi:hypothetical protein
LGSRRRAMTFLIATLLVPFLRKVAAPKAAAPAGH